MCLFPPSKKKYTHHKSTSTSSSTSSLPKTRIITDTTTKTNTSTSSSHKSRTKTKTKTKRREVRDGSSEVGKGKRKEGQGGQGDNKGEGKGAQMTIPAMGFMDQEIAFEEWRRLRERQGDREHERCWEVVGRDVERTDSLRARLSSKPSPAPTASATGSGGWAEKSGGINTNGKDDDVFKKVAEEIYKKDLEKALERSRVDELMREYEAEGRKKKEMAEVERKAREREAIEKRIREIKEEQERREAVEKMIALELEKEKEREKERERKLIEGWKLAEAERQRIHTLIAAKEEKGRQSRQQLATEMELERKEKIELEVQKREFERLAALRAKRAWEEKNAVGEKILGAVGELNRKFEEKGKRELWEKEMGKARREGVKEGVKSVREEIRWMGDLERLRGGKGKEDWGQREKERERDREREHTVDLLALGLNWGLGAAKVSEKNNAAKAGKVERFQSGYVVEEVEGEWVGKKNGVDFHARNLARGLEKRVGGLEGDVEGLMRGRGRGEGKDGSW